MANKKFFIEKWKMHGSVNDYKIQEYALREKNVCTPLLISTKGYCEILCKTLNKQQEEVYNLKSEIKELQRELQICKHFNKENNIIPYNL